MGMRLDAASWTRSVCASGQSPCYKTMQEVVALQVHSNEENVCTTVNCVENIDCHNSIIVWRLHSIVFYTLLIVQCPESH